MPLYHFNLDNAVEAIHVGSIDLPDTGAARDQAVRFVGEIMNGEPDLLFTGHNLSVYVSNAAGTDLFHILVSMTGCG